VILRAPRVGVWSEHPAPGLLVGPGSPAGVLTELGVRTALVIPEGVAGRVAEPRAQDRAVAVGYGGLLFRVFPLAQGEAASAVHDATPVPAASGAKAVTAPTDGVFYRSPSPGAKAYVAPGDRVTAGQAVGLIEVMKTFSPIVYGEPPLPAEAEVVEILAADGVEVRAGQPLIAVR
jgi:biotin carboxyl carrier protein